MINLIKNEFIKLLKKKSIYIVLIITLLFVVLINFLYKYTSNNSYSRYFEDDIDYYSQCLKSLDSNNPDEVEAYADIKTQLDIVTLISKYGFDTWQANIIPEKLGSSIGSINYYTYIEKNETALANAKQEYDKLVEILDSNNWKYFANIELKELNEKINLEENAKLAITDKSSLEESNYILNIYKIDKQVLEWRLSKDISYDNSFLNTALNDYANYSKHILSYERDNDSTYSEKLEYYNSLERANINKYYIENNITNIRDDDNRDILINLLNEYELFILIFIIMISGSIVSDEFSKGTIKLLLVRPYNRLKILSAKFITCLCMLICFIIFISVCQLFVGGIVQGFNCLNVPAVVYNHNTNTIETMSIAKHIVITSCAKLPMYLLLMTLAFTISTLFTNSALAIALPLLGYMVSSIINQLALYALSRNIKILLYFVTPNWDLTNYLFGGLPMFESITLPFSITICLIYLLIMVFASAIIFKKRNIKNI